MSLISISEISMTEKNLSRISVEIAEKLEVAEKMACTEENKKAVKEYKAELNKQFLELEAER